MTHDPKSDSITRLIRWCFGIFLASAILLSGILIYAWWNGDLRVYLTSAGIVYLCCSVFFLLVIMAAFIGGHLGTSSEIESPKLDIFEQEKLR